MDGLAQAALDLQALDSTVDLLRHRRTHLAERAAMAAAREAETGTVRYIGELESEASEGGRRITELEEQSAALLAHRERLERQLRSVTAAREADALQHEITALNERRSRLDDEGLELLERTSAVDEERSALQREIPRLQAAAVAMADDLASAEAVIDTELEALTARRPTAVDALPDGFLERYEQGRRHSSGIAVGHLEGTRCSGCNLDLSRSEVEAVRAVPDGDVGECPHCGRMLVA